MWNHLVSPYPTVKMFHQVASPSTIEVMSLTSLKYCCLIKAYFQFIESFFFKSCCLFFFLLISIPIRILSRRNILGIVKGILFSFLNPPSDTLFCYKKFVSDTNNVNYSTVVLWSSIFLCVCSLSNIRFFSHSFY